MDRLLSEKNRQQKRGGGLCIYFKENVPCTRLSELEEDNIESIWITLRSHKLPMNINTIAFTAIYHALKADHKAMSYHISYGIDQSQSKTSKLCFKYHGGLH